MFIFNKTITIGNGYGNVPKKMIHVYLIGYSKCYYMDILHNYEKLPAQKLLPKFLFRKDFDQTWKENSGKFELVFCPKTVLCRLNIGFLARQTPHMIMSSAEQSIAHISLQRHQRRWCTFFKPVYFFPKGTRKGLL